MRFNFFLLVSLVVLICHNTQVTAVGDSNSVNSCAQRLLVPIGDKSVLAEGVLEEIASAYVDAIWTNIVEIHSSSSVLKGFTNREQVYLPFQDKVMDELKSRVYHEFVENLRSKHFLLRRFVKGSNSIQESGLPPWGSDLVLGVVAPVLSAVGASWYFVDQGDLGLAFSLTSSAAAMGVFISSNFRSADRRIHNQSEALTLLFHHMVTAKLGEKLLSVFPEERVEDRKSLAWWSENGRTRNILDAVFLYLEETVQREDAKEIVFK